jgi:hypothetical protein
MTATSAPPVRTVTHLEQIEEVMEQVEPSEVEAHAPWVTQPRVVRTEAHSEALGKAPMTAPPAHTVAAEPPAAPPVQVTIGRLEVRAVTPTRVPVPRSRPLQNSSSLEEYLRRSAKR